MRRIEAEFSKACSAHSVRSITRIGAETWRNLIESRDECERARHRRDADSSRHGPPARVNVHRAVPVISSTRSTEPRLSKDFLPHEHELTAVTIWPDSAIAPRNRTPAGRPRL